jgi:hypothetical protein
LDVDTRSTTTIEIEAEDNGADTVHDPETPIAMEVTASDVTGLATEDEGDNDAAPDTQDETEYVPESDPEDVQSGDDAEDESEEEEEVDEEECEVLEGFEVV